MQNWDKTLPSALLPMAVLSVVRNTPLHGYGIVQQLKHIEFGEFKGGTIYPLLKRLEVDELINSNWVHPNVGAAKKVFHITDKGEAALNQWLRKADDLLKLLSTTHKESKGSTDEYI